MSLTLKWALNVTTQFYDVSLTSQFFKVTISNTTLYCIIFRAQYSIVFLIVL